MWSDLISGGWNREFPLYTYAYRGVLISEGWNREFLYTEVSLFQGVGIAYRGVLISGGWNSI